MKNVKKESELTNMVYGRRPVAEILRSGIGVSFIIIKDNVRGENIQDIKTLADNRKIPVRV